MLGKNMSKMEKLLAPLAVLAGCGYLFLCVLGILAVSSPAVRRAFEENLLFLVLIQISVMICIALWLGCLYVAASDPDLQHRERTRWLFLLLLLNVPAALVFAYKRSTGRTGDAASARAPETRDGNIG